MNGATSQYREMYVDTLEPIKKHLIFQPMTRDNEDILFSGQLHVEDSGNHFLEPLVQHLGCFAGGMLALGAKLMNSKDDLRLARKLTDGCIWAYNSTASGLMPEVFTVTACNDPCEWSEDHWRSAIASHLEKAEGDTRSTHEQVEAKIKDDGLSESFTKINDRRYILRQVCLSLILCIL